MKKVSITLLLILPFILIFAISFLGKIYSNVAHIKPEYIAIFVDDVPQENGVVLNYDIDDDGYDAIPLDIRVMPTLASNKEFEISNDNPKASEIKVGEDRKSASLYLKDKGVSKYTVNSVEDTSIKYNFSIVVEFGQLRNFGFFDMKNHTQQIEEISIPVGRTKDIGIEVFPNTTRKEFRDFEWEFTYNGENIKDIPQFSPVGVDIRESNTMQASIEGLRVGEVIASVHSKGMPELVKTLKIKVTEKDETSKAYFNYFNSEQAFIAMSYKFDFKLKGGDDEEGKILFNDTSLTYDDCVIKCDNQYIDKSQLDNLVIENTNSRPQIVVVSLYLKNANGDIGQKVDSIVVRLDKAV